MFEKIIPSTYLVLLLNIDPNQPSALVNGNLLNIRNVFSSFITINREAHIWYQEVYHALDKIQYAGSLGNNGLLIKGPKKSLNVIKRVYSQRLLQAPFGFVIFDLGKSKTFSDVKHLESKSNCKLHYKINSSILNDRILERFRLKISSNRKD